MGPSECMRHCAGLPTSTPAALSSIRSSAHIPARYTSALRGSLPAVCMAYRRIAATSSSAVPRGVRVTSVATDDVRQSSLTV